MIIIKIALIFFVIVYLYLYIKNVSFKKDISSFSKKKKYAVIGLVTNFLDFLGIGSYATQTLVLENDEKYNKDIYLIPGTLSVGNIIPIAVQAIIVLNILNMDILTITLLPISAAIGGYIGSKFISKKNNDLIKQVLSFALFVTSILLIMNAFNIPPFNNIETNLHGLAQNPQLLILAIIIFFVLGVLQSFGLGMYAPGFAILGLMGMSYLYIMPINMVSAVLLSLSNSVEFITKEKYIKPVSFYIMVFGVIGVVLAATFSYVIDFTKIIFPLQVIIAIIALVTAVKIYKSRAKQN